MSSVSIKKVRRASIATSTPAPKVDVGHAHQLTMFEVVLHLLNGNIGAGALSLPYAFAKVGVFVGPSLYAVLAAICMYNMDLLLHCKRIVSPNASVSFGEVAKRILGPDAKNAVNVFLVGTQLSFCCIYFTVVATNVRAILPDALAIEFQERQLVVLIYPILLMLSWIRHLCTITPFAVFANCAVFLGVAIVFYYSITIALSSSPQTSQSPAIQEVGWYHLAEFYGLAVYSFEGIGLVLPLEKDSQDKASYRVVLLVTMGFLLVLFLFLGELPVLAFGTIDNGSMTAVLQEYVPGIPVTLANVFMAISCLFSFPIQFYPAIQVLEKLLLRRGYLTPTIRSYDEAATIPTPHILHGTHIDVTPLPPFVELVLNTSKYEIRRTLFRSMLCTLLMLVAVCVPNIGLLISLFGSVGSSVLAVIIPPILYIHVQQEPKISRLSWFFHMALIVFGIAGMVAGTVQALIDIVDKFYV
ncbi:Aste57867_13348 [Aphanomyces stellatus]|uniref:Aste57867_13348 protein n=1 Tax=Aphanomyces stellatus TaxID=120398 RepID=A0A485KZL2_9STRA|nr:hypothetical protein As57867_013298 [Aphanomyces stellatus]VFT90187.1 Aste57867_13348 [Aphanomyces stellatus]